MSILRDLINLQFDNESQPSTTHNIWVSGCPHTIKDLENKSRESIGIPLAQIDAGAFDFDLALMLGDFASTQTPVETPAEDAQGQENANQLNSSVLHDVAKIYPITGNHDAGVLNNDWFLKWIDPQGANTGNSGVNNANRPYPITWMDNDINNFHTYYISVGNVRIYMMGDRNELPYPWGRGDGDPTGIPSGTVTKASWEWVKTTMESRTDLNYIICTHMNPRFTTIATPDGDRDCGGHNVSGIAAGSGSLYSIYDEDVPANTDDGTDQFKQYFIDNPDHRVCLWMGSHTHHKVGASCGISGVGPRGPKYTENGVQYLNIANLTKDRDNGGLLQIDPKSWLLNVDNSRINLKLYLHMESVDGYPIGFYQPEEFNINLKV